MPGGEKRKKKGYTALELDVSGSDDDFSDQENSPPSWCHGVMKVKEDEEDDEEDEEDERDEKKKKERYNHITETLGLDELQKNVTKRHFCFFCKKPKSRVQKHWRVVHKKEPEIEEILKLPVESKQRKAKEIELKRLGDYENNQSVEKLDKGTYAPHRRPTKGQNMTCQDYIPCPGCSKFLTKGYLTKHIKSGKCPKSKGKAKNIIQQAAVAVKHKNHEISDELASVLQTLRRDEVTSAIMADQQILNYGQDLLDKQLDLERMTRYIRSALRQAGKFVLKLREELESPKGTMATMILPVNWDTIVIAAKDFQSLGFTLKIGAIIVKMAKQMRAQAQITEDEDREKKMTAILQLHEGRWGNKVSSKLLKKMKRDKLNKRTIHVSDSDLNKFNTGLKSLIKQGTEKLRLENDPKAALDLISACMTYTISLNRRRSGEVGWMKLSDFLQSKENQDAMKDEDIYKRLDLIEKRLCDEFFLAKIVGKSETFTDKQIYGTKRA